MEEEEREKKSKQKTTYDAGSSVRQGAGTRAKDKERIKDGTRKWHDDHTSFGLVRLVRLVPLGLRSCACSPAFSWDSSTS